MINVEEELKRLEKKTILKRYIEDFSLGDNYDYPLYEVMGAIVHYFQNELYAEMSDFVLHYCLEGTSKKQITKKQYAAIKELCSRCDPRDTQEYFYEKTEEILNGHEEK